MKSKQILAWLGLASTLLALWVWQAWQDDATSSTHAAIGSSSAPVDETDLRIDAWAAEGRVVQNEKLPVSISIYNPTSAAVSVTFARFQHPGFDIADSRCWKGGVPRCIDNDGMPLFVELPRAVPPHESVTFLADLRAGSEPGRYAVASVIVWSPEGKRATRRKPITLRPITVEGRVAGWVLLFLHAFQSFVKDLALPLALAFLGFWLKKQEDLRADQRKSDDEARARQRTKDDEDRARRRKEEDDARDLARRQDEEARLEQRKAAAEKNAYVQQTWNLMLLKSHQNTERHYMPMGTAARRVSEYWQETADFEKNEPARFDLCFFSYLLFLSRVRRMIRAIGGFYFKSRHGEVIAGALWEFVVDRSDDIFTRECRDRATKVLPPQFTYAEYRDTIADDAAVKPMRKAFGEHLKEFAPLVVVLDALAFVLEYEMNRPYEHWYQQREPFDTDGAAKLVRRMRSAGSELTKVRQAFEQYANQAGDDVLA